VFKFFFLIAEMKNHHLTRSALYVCLILIFPFLLKIVFAEVEHKTRGLNPLSAGNKKGNNAFKVEALEVSVQGRPISATVWNENNGKPILVMCAMHGDERNAALLGKRLDEEWKKRPETLDGVYVILIPLVNPDGMERGTRGNGNGVDLNRNFPITWKPSDPINDNYGGKKPLSEPESRMLAALLQKRTPSRIISVHNRRRIEGEPLNIYDGSPTAFAIADTMRKYNNYKVSRGVGYPVPGSFFKYARRNYNVIFNTLEMPDTEDFDNAIWPANSKAILAALLYRPR